MQGGRMCLCLADLEALAVASTLRMIKSTELSESCSPALDNTQERGAQLTTSPALAC